MKSTRGLWLSTRFRQKSFEGEACLLVYDDEPFDDMLIGRDLKAVFDQRANTAHIYVVAPFVTADVARAALGTGAAVRRAAPYLAGVAGTISLVEVVPASSGGVQVVATQLSMSGDVVLMGAPSILPSELREGWLFDLFHRNEGLVEAPAGIHFKKGSGRHSDKFLRTANVLTSSASCALLALFCLEKLSAVAQPRRVFVDTSPLISVAFAMMRLAHVHGAWLQDVPARSFSSYGGMRGIGRISQNDIILVSASTSGSLAKELVAMGARVESIVTFYYLASEGATSVPSGVLCDLTMKAERTFGYRAIANYPASGCPLCDAELLAVDLEGDQFLLQKREYKPIRIIKGSQPDDAKGVLEQLARTGLLRIALRQATRGPRIMNIDGDALLHHARVRSTLVRHLRRFCPVPLDIVVRDGVSERELRALLSEAGLDNVTATSQFVASSDLPTVQQIPRGGALVVYGCLDDHARARYINATLRSVVPQGAVTYLSALTLSESAEHLRDLKRFLQYGEHGAETFSYKSAFELAFPVLHEAASAWEAELTLLNALCARPEAPAELVRRRDWLTSEFASAGDLFWAGAGRQALTIQNDFVFLDTAKQKDLISQADIFVVIANALSCARCGNEPLLAKAPASGKPVRWLQSVYGQMLLSPSNFLDFNDAILRASFLRAASPHELLYSVDEQCSEAVFQVIRAELAAWLTGSGDALPEMLMALASQRLRLDERHIAQLKTECADAPLPAYLQWLAEAIGK